MNKYIEQINNLITCLELDIFNASGDDHKTVYMQGCMAAAQWCKAVLEKEADPIEAQRAASKAVNSFNATLVKGGAE